MSESYKTNWEFFSVEQRWFYSARIIEVFVKVGDRLEYDTLLARVETEAGKTIDLFNDTARTGIIIKVYWKAGEQLDALDPDDIDEIDVLRYWSSQTERDITHPFLDAAQNSTKVIPLLAPDLGEDSAVITSIASEGWRSQGEDLYEYSFQGALNQVTAECDGYFVDRASLGTVLGSKERVGKLLIGWKPKGYHRVGGHEMDTS